MSVQDDTVRQNQDDENRPATARDLATIFDGLSLRLLAGSAALFLGVIYAFGAIIKAGELRGADQRVGDTLPLVPLEQLLVLGINSILPLGAVAIVLLLILMALTERAAASVSKAEASKKPRSKRLKKGVPRWLAWSILGIWFVFAFVSVQWIGWVLFAQLFAGTRYARSRHTTPKANVLFTSFALTITFAGMAYLAPAPLPQIDIRTYRDRNIKGELIATSGNTWYIALAKERWMAVEGRTIQRVDVSARDKEEQKSLYEELTGSNFLGLGP